MAGGFSNGEYNSINDIFYKSGGQVDGGFPLAEKFGPEIASAGRSSQSGSFNPIPDWTYICNGIDSSSCNDVYSSVNTMRVFNENGIEKIATTFRSPQAAILTLNTGDGSEDRFRKTNDKDKNQDIEVELDSSGVITGQILSRFENLEGY